MTPIKFGKYEVRKQLGQGGFGTVYLAYDPHLKRQVAIKTCTSSDPDLRRRFAREAQLAADLVHPNITTVFEFGEEGGAPYLVQEYLPGEDLSVKIARREKISSERKLNFLVGVAKGLEYAHSRGVVHRDIKPGNIRVLNDDRVKIMDFGIAKLLQAESQLTRTGMTMGTAGYLPPEQIRGRAVDQRADIFSFGVLAYELLTNRRPFRGEDISAVFFSILNEEPRPVVELRPDCPQELGDLVRRCLEKEPADRFQNFGLLIADLGRISSSPWQEIAEPTLQQPMSVKRSIVGTGLAEGSVLVSGGRTTLGDGFEHSSFLTGLRLRRMSLLWLGLSVGAVAAVLIGLWSLSSWFAAGGPEISEENRLAANPDPRESASVAPSPASAGPLGVVEQPKPLDEGSVTPTQPRERGRRIVSVATELSTGGTVNSAGESRAATATPAKPDALGAPDPAGPHSSPSPLPPRGVTPPQPEPLPYSAAPVPERQPAIEPTPPRTAESRRILVILAGTADAGVETAEGALLRELSVAGAETASVGFQSPSQREGLVTGSPPELAALGRRYAADLVVIGRLLSEAEPSLGRFFVGRAVLDLRIFEASTGRQFGVETVQVGGDGRQGKAGTSAMAARIAAAQEAGRMAAQRVVRTGILAKNGALLIEGARDRTTFAKTTRGQPPAAPNLTER